VAPATTCTHMAPSSDCIVKSFLCCATSIVAHTISLPINPAIGVALNVLLDFAI
jgi:hypothetical protein